ncbi:hypothetical protein VB796_06550 [Arcicella sp. LKC2W]|uniref:hypothetical protein n=1 Tax=Arcicella sp. LKC2W TaxID=2984198 RepID=UPI002B21A0C8|nr:hypothetical protein [Arcicella sp. LKC2W]MEA5458687.1 hypothetical protein [Arcicella sp. LKC2W]
MTQILIEAEELGKLFFTQTDIETILYTNPDSIQGAIRKGQLLSDAEVRKVVIQQAKSGSGEAQKIVENWKNAIKFENALRT